MKNSLLGWLVLWVILAGTGIAQDVEPEQPVTVDSSGITLSAMVDKNTVPLNRTVTFTLRLQWQGSLDRYNVHRFDNPMVQNLEIVASSSSNRVIQESGQTIAIQDYRYTLKPTQLGMAYIKDVIIKYTDNTDERSYTLRSSRIPVKIVDPVAEPGSKIWILFLFIGIVVVAVGAFVIIARQKMIVEKARIDAAQAAARVPLEQTLLEEMKATIDLDDTHTDVGAVMSHLSRIARSYITEKYQGPAFESTTTELIGWMRENDLDDRMIKDIEIILKQADLVKFSGHSRDRQIMDQNYVRLESLLRRQLNPESLNESQDNADQEAV
jgi:hypothetical protein